MRGSPTSVSSDESIADIRALADRAKSKAKRNRRTDVVLLADALASTAQMLEDQQNALQSLTRAIQLAEEVSNKHQRALRGLARVRRLPRPDGLDQPGPDDP